MPLYEYQCARCGRFEVIRKFSDEPLVTCPTCGGEIQKLFSAPAIQFKGTGWYITDYARKSSGGAEGSGKSGESKSGESKGGESKGGEGGSTASGAKDGGSSSTDTASKSETKAAASGSSGKGSSGGSGGTE